jgi:hypothetical protein
MSFYWALCEIVPEPKLTYQTMPNSQCHNDTTCKYWNLAGSDLLHREDGPAVEYVNGDRSWFIYGKRHRMDGPAVEWGDRMEWWINGERLDCNTQEEFQRLMRLKGFW